MAKIICQHSGVEFEAKSTRTKQHPLVASFKNTNVSNYRDAMTALETAKEIGGYTTIEQYISLVEEILSGKISESNAREQKRGQN